VKQRVTSLYGKHTPDQLIRIKEHVLGGIVFTFRVNLVLIWG